MGRCKCYRIFQIFVAPKWGLVITLWGHVEVNPWVLSRSSGAVEHTQQIFFSHEYTYSVDKKNRLNIPSQFRKPLELIGERQMVLVQGFFDTCLNLYPAYEWADVQQNLIKLSSVQVGYRDFVREIARNTVFVHFDNQGRILIPEKLLKFAKIGSQAVVIGMYNYIEIWSPEELDAKQSSVPPIDKEQLKQLPFELNF